MNVPAPDTVGDAVRGVAVVVSSAGLIFVRRIFLAWHAAWRFERASKNGWNTGTLADVLDTANGRRPKPPEG